MAAPALSPALTAALSSPSVRARPPCPACNLTFATKSSARRHYKRFHATKEELMKAVEKREEAPRPRFPCSCCQKTFARNSHAKRHFKRFHSFPITPVSGEALPIQMAEPEIPLTKPSGQPLPLSPYNPKIHLTGPTGETLPKEEPMNDEEPIAADTIVTMERSKRSQEEEEEDAMKNWEIISTASIMRHKPSALTIVLIPH